MNSLNSVLLEGIVCGTPKESKTESDKDCCSFRISCDRIFKQGDNIVKEVSRFNIESYNDLAKYCLKHLTTGRGVRIVGRLKQANRKVIVITEHVELKPVVTTQNKTKAV